MKNNLEARRLKLLQEIASVDREIALTQKSAGQIKAEIVAMEQQRAKAA